MRERAADKISEIGNISDIFMGDDMERKLILINAENFPESVKPFLERAKVYDSSCSEDAKVFFLDTGDGFYLKTAAKGTLKREAELTDFFNKKGFASEVLLYETAERDFLLTRRVKGEDCIFKKYLDNPERLCETTAQILRSLHETSFDGCPVKNRTEEYLERVKRNYGAGLYDLELFGDIWSFASAEDAFAQVEKSSKFLKADTLIHGDYCLPNIMLDDWKFTGFVDLDSGGVGDRHIDIFWGIWTLWFNLKTNKYKDRFIDAYGRENVEEEMLRTVAAA